jgi:hypothetical protein
VRQRNVKKLSVAINVHDELIAGSDESDVDVFIDQFHRKITTGTLSYFLEMLIEQLRMESTGGSVSTRKRSWSDSRCTKQIQ